MRHSSSWFAHIVDSYVTLAWRISQLLSVCARVSSTVVIDVYGAFLLLHLYMNIFFLSLSSHVWRADSLTNIIPRRSKQEAGMRGPCPRQAVASGILSVAVFFIFTVSLLFFLFFFLCSCVGLQCCRTLNVEWWFGERSQANPLLHFIWRVSSTLSVTLLN
jgi:hypothetical protein